METNTHAKSLDRVLLTWTAPERPSFRRGKLWYAIAVIFAVGMLTYAIVSRDWAFTIVVLCASTGYFLIHHRPHPLHTITIGEMGVQMDRKIYEWDACEGYWMLQGPDYVELHIEVNKPRKAHLCIQTGDTDFSEIDATMARFLPFLKDRREKPIDYISRICKL